MRPLELLGWVAFMAVGSKCDISPETAERMCRQSEARYKGPPMPKIVNATFSGRGCPSPESRLAYNYMGKWRCGGDKYDAKFVMPGVDLRAGGGDMRKAECAITFHVEGLAEGWQVAVSSGELEGNWEVSSGGMPRFIGTSSWDGGPQQVSAPPTTSLTHIPWLCPRRISNKRCSPVPIGRGRSVLLIFPWTADPRHHQLWEIVRPLLFVCSRQRGRWNPHSQVQSHLRVWEVRIKRDGDRG